MNNNNKRLRRKPRSKNQSSFATRPQGLPKAITTTPYITRRIRYLTAAAVANVGITNGNLLTNWCLATAATVGYSLVAATRVRSVEMWYANENPASPQQLIIEGAPQSGAGNPYVGNASDLHIVTSLGSSQVAYVKWKPKKLSSADVWISNNSSVTYTLFNLSAPAGTVIDLVVDVQMVDDEPALLGPALVGAVVGTVYNLSLDHSSGGKIVPIGLNAI